jgi:hypothetical protein
MIHGEEGDRLTRIETHSGEEVPSAHLPAVLILDISHQSFVKADMIGKGTHTR